ncbi:uncharacterized protein [Physcomitrium patens]|uniref:Uncharacterized protein n=1 Tax=Physcomitrium patens TaxID=3218 RepID=A0A2K1KCA0_PHYPA|nr:aspartic and glutamic acid-rich protein-like isoform X1 [Physcomitrium patens]XP_024381365.1 aspartic and glutamic acid-rich protein-like isoform X1 [Physcomitrium patens]XP_024381366.1 aspartic and glutamic acid-rich protein-like isoform X1 [Physcomitrium patens]XP_024381367.1 aspartic and glutamic acid-rich protein-like isoform X1 [Physcomitrium patens]XP_024381369.1 aspartic and glutamic acid-rich protein-like isoform X1 [Physcomitrium patens]PNR51414.1 hypothetical protein PHYPA_010601 |eukprot:XP_024381364.1 aspartic and glutamic acid-rich protein-like isoform X1 [Physcomitrella patens]
MYRHHSPRYQGAKGLKVKHVLQIAILTVILTWVVYELSRIQKSSPSDGQDRSSLQATIPEPLSGRKVLKPRDKPGKLDWELEIDDTTTKSSSEENLVWSKSGEDPAIKEQALYGMDIGQTTDKDEKSLEEEAQANDDADGRRDVGTDFADTKNKESLAGDEDKKGEETEEVTYMEAYNADSGLKAKLDKQDEVEADDTSRSRLKERDNPATGNLKEDDGISDQEVTESNVSTQDEVEDEQVDPNAQFKEHPELNVDNLEENKGSLEVEAKEQRLKKMVDTQTQGEHFRYEPTEENILTQKQGEEEKAEEKIDAQLDQQNGTLPRSEEQNVSKNEAEVKIHTLSQEQEKIQETLDLNDTVSGTQKYVAVKDEEDLEKADATQTLKEPQKAANGSDSSTLVSEDESNKYVQPKEDDADQMDTSDNQDQVADAERLQTSQLKHTANEKEEAQDQDNEEKENDKVEDLELQTTTEQKSDSSLETKQAEQQEPELETDSKNAEDSSDSSSEEVKRREKHDSAVTANMDASTVEESKIEDEVSKNEILNQVTESNTAGSGDFTKESNV